MQIAFQQNRKAIVGECRQLKTDMDSYNDAHQEAAPLQISFDFNMDIAEFEAAMAA
jgi:alpha-D-ribose 1-methylphosphonate 5-triphosphate diphosphatase PhnM